ncbi:MAG: hypothetical protein GF401_12465 [Chitinivibrionales bacterium]|nr:hypothetical protein [Chitinivibrionales bacterium]
MDFANFKSFQLYLFPTLIPAESGNLSPTGYRWICFPEGRLVMSKKQLRILLFVAVAVVGTGAALWVAWIRIVPGIIERRIQETLVQQGIDPKAIEIASIEYNKIVLKNIMIGTPDTIAAENVIVYFCPLALLLEREVTTIAIYGLKTTLAPGEREVGPSPFPDWQEKLREITLPFELIKLYSSTIEIQLENRRYSVTIEGSVKKAGTDSLDIQARAETKDAAANGVAVVRIPALTGHYEVAIDSMSFALLNEIRETYFPDTDIAMATWQGMQARAEISVDTGSWRADALLYGTDMVVQINSESFTSTIGVDTITTFLTRGTDDTSTARLTGTFAGGNFSARGAFDLATFQGEYAFAGDELAADSILKIVRPFVEIPQITTAGMVALQADGIYDLNRIDANVSIGGRNFYIATTGGEYDIQFYPDTVQSTLLLVSPGNRWRMQDLLIRIPEGRLTSSTPALKADSISITAPLSFNGSLIEEGSFALSKITLSNQPMPSVQGNFAIRNNRLGFTGRSTPLPEAPLGIEGWIDWSSTPASGHIEGRVPEFELDNEKLLTQRWLPALQGDILNGFYALEHDIWWTGNSVIQRLKIATRNGSWRRPSATTGILGVEGELELDNLTPPLTPDAYWFAVDSAYTGSFCVNEAAVKLAITETAPLLVQTVAFKWAGGNFRSHDIVIDFEKTRLQFTLSVDQVDLQEILNFFRYKGARITGKASGELPITLRWNGDIRVEIGAGTLKTGPETGTVKFTKETAMTILGIKEDIPADTRDLEKKVRSMALGALQDLLYTDLEVAFEPQPNGQTMARVHLEGQGPSGAVENQIPIGGLNLRIHNIEGIINQIIRQSGRRRIQFR